MEQQQQPRRVSIIEPEVIASLDPLIETIHRNRSSVFYIPAPTTDENKEENIWTKYISYIERFSGIMYSLLSAFLLSCTNFSLKQFNVSLLDVFLIRLAIQAFIALGYIIYKGYRPFSSNSYALLTFIQSLIAGIGTTCLYIALLLLPLPDFATIRHTQVVWATLLSFLILRERLTLPIILSCILTFLGVICIAQPSFLFSKLKSSNETFEISLNPTNDYRLVGMFIALFCAFSLSISVLLNKILFEKQIHQSLILFYFFLSTFTGLLLVHIYYWKFSQINQEKFNIKKLYLTKDFLFATIIAVLQIIPMIFQQKAIKHEHPSIVSVIFATEILFSIILQNIFLTNKSNKFTLIGSTLVLISIIILCTHKFCQDRHNRTLISISNQENN